MYFDVSVIILIVLMMGKNMDFAPTRIDYDTEWEELFGHLSKDAEDAAPVSRFTKPDKFIIGKQGQPKPSVPPTPPEPPFVFDPTSKNKKPSLGANSQGDMEGISISQNRGISLSIYMVNSTYNSLNTAFGHSKNF